MIFREIFSIISTMRELSRVFQGILETPSESVQEELKVAMLVKHEITRVFQDKLARQQDKDFVDGVIVEFMTETFGEALTEAAQEAQQWWCDFQKEAGEDPETGEEIPAPKVYEPMNSMTFVREKGYEYLKRYNEQFPAKSMNLVLFDDALKYMMKINCSEVCVWSTEEL